MAARARYLGVHRCWRRQGHSNGHHAACCFFHSRPKAMIAHGGVLGRTGHVHHVLQERHLGTQPEVGDSLRGPENGGLPLLPLRAQFSK